MRDSIIKVGVVCSLCSATTMACVRPLVLYVLFTLASTQDGSNAPVFEPLFSSDGVTFTVNEGAVEGTEVGLVRAQGLPHETVLYGLEVQRDEWEGAFEIDTSSGEITVGPNGSEILVIDGVPLSITFQVFAYYEGSYGNRSNLSVTVEVADVNSSPYFEDVETDLSVVEGIMVGELVQRFTATDDDLGSNAALEYSLRQVQPNGNTNDSFAIQRYTGDVTVADRLNLSYTYRLTIIATDEGDPPLSSSLNVSVRVDPVPPAFSQLVYEAYNPEFTDKVGVPVVNVSATTLSGEPVIYSIVSWTPAPGGLNFTVGPLSGLVEASGTLDRELFSRYTIIVKAYEHPDASTEATVVLHVSDVNEPPQFLRSHYTVSVTEGVGPGDILSVDIKALDRDEGSNAELAYSINTISGLRTSDGVSDNISTSTFTINATTAELLVNTDLEREAEMEGYHYYEITVAATDGGTPSLSASCLVTVTVTDINDNRPIFSSSSYTFNISESVGEGGIVGTVQVSDRDDGIAANITFSLSGPGSNQFRIAVFGVTHPPTVQSRPPTVTMGRIYLTEQLDREEVSHYDITVQAQDTTNQPLTGTAQIVINVLDYNDNRPQFDNETYNFEVYEGTLLEDNGGIIGSINATDADEGPNGEFDFSLAVGTAERAIFSLQSSGSAVALRLQRALDREMTDVYSLRLQAMDRGSPALVGEATINITVLDVNDQVPMFSEDVYEVNVTEDTAVGASLLTVTASDADIEENAAVLYSVGSGSVVTVDGDSGDVELVTMLDYEMNSRLQIKITARDSGSPQQTGTATVLINVVDINDNAPIFDKTNYSVTIAEDVTTGTELIRVVATDADSGERSAITFSLSGPKNDTFALGSMSGALTIATFLDREQTEEYEFTITATDMGMPPLSSTAQLYVTVLDVNDNAPVFEQSSYTAEVSESISADSPVGAAVTQVTATDADAGSNGEITYHLFGSGAENFHIDSATGEVTVARPLDFESVTGPFVLTVIAQDNGESPAMSNGVILQITVTDGNDHAPTFLNLPYVVRLEEGTVGPLVVLVANATDLDEGSNGEVEFLLIEGKGLFSADRGGNVSLLAGKEVDREGEGVEVGEGGEGVIILSLTAVDNGSPIQLSQTDLTVFISDLNDNPPVFQQTAYSVQVSEGLPDNSDILNVLATDADYGSNADVVYAIESQQPSLADPTFTIDNRTGVISLSTTLDRESHPSFSLTISASDRGVPSLTTSVTVTINVTDVNDNHPLFTIPAGGYVTSLAEDTPPGSEVITVVATDRDTGLHSQITYSLSDTSVPFQIQNPEVGTITVSSSLDREMSAQYNLIVVATDTVADSQSTLQTETMVTITILDVNDNAPIFLSASYEARVNENQPLGTTITLFPDLVATDADSASNGVITFNLTGADSQYFMLDPQTAAMTTQETLDAEVVEVYTDLQLTATDNGGLSSSVPLTVTVGDENDFAPFFTIGINSTTTVSESLLPGAVVFIVTAMDGDVQGDTFNFTLGGIQHENGSSLSDSPFLIDSVSGAITVGERGLDFELSFYYVLTVNVEDSGTPPRSNSTELLIVLTDVNDNTPEFTPQTQPFLVVENSLIGTTVGRVLVRDADSVELTELQYLIVGGNEGGRFNIDPVTGDIATSADIDREERETYTLIIEARDGPELFRAGTGTALITISDINDHHPSFSPLTVDVTEEMPPGTLVAEYAAVDGDKGENGTLFYQILASLPENHFIINSTTGNVFTTTELDRETIDSYRLIIEADDGGTPSLTGLGSLTVELTDVNDNSPLFVGSSDATIIENPLVGSIVSSNLTAIDRDEGSNADLTWRIASGNVFDAFSVDETTGAILVRNATELDFETTPIFFLQLLVEDAGQPQLSSTLLLRVSLLDANDHAPSISPVSPLTLPENTLVNSIVAVVTATDEDEGTNADLSFFVVSGNVGGVFSIREDGTLRTIAALDYESVVQYNLIVEVHDGGTPTLIDSTTVIIMITDINDNAPNFTNLPSTVQISESTVNPQIATISIEDPDSGDNGLYSLDVVSVDGGDPSRFFIVFTFLRAEGSLDYEEQSQYTLVLEASDHGEPSLTTQVELIVNVRDIDDNPPIFPEPPHYIISEAQPILTPFAILRATDLDTEDINRNAFYYITDGATVENFDVISQTGQLFLNQLLDRESVAVHVLEITVQSFLGDTVPCTELSCSVTNVTVSLVDVNDNAPQWILGEFIIGVNETALPNDTIGKIQAEDLDTDDFSLVWYELTDTSTTVVILEEETGVLRLNQSLDELQGRVSPVFTATAFDNRGQDSSLKSTNVAIRIVSLNAEYLVVVTIAMPLKDVLNDTLKLYRAVEMVPGASLSVYDIREHSQPDNSQMTKRQSSGTDVVLFGLHSQTGALLTAQKTLEVLSVNRSVIDDLFTVSGIMIFPTPSSAGDSEGINDLSLVIVVAAVVVAVLIAVLCVTICGCCWLQSRIKQKRKYYDPGQRSTHRAREPRERVRYSTAEGVEMHGKGEGYVGEWGVQHGWDEEDEFSSKQVKLRSTKGSRGPVDSGTRPRDSCDSEDIRGSVLYDSKDFVMDVFEDSDGDETEEEGVEITPAANFTTHAVNMRADYGSLELKEQNRAGYRDAGEGESESEGESEEEEEEEEEGEEEGDTVQQQSHLMTVAEAEEEEEEEEEWAGGEGAGVWEEGEGQVWEDDALSPADMMTEEEARMLAAPLDQDTLPSPLLF